MANLGRFNELLTDYESSIRRGGILPNWKKDLEGLCWYMNSYATGAYEEQPADDLRGADALQIMTIHQAKGLEWPVVFVPCLVNKRFPTSKLGEEQDWYVPKELFDFKRYQGDIEDERRLFYVAITRARDVLTISRFAQMNGRVRGPSIFWDPLEKHLNESDQRANLNPSKIEQLVDLEEMQTYTAGEIITYNKCPYMYRLRRMWGYQPPDLPLELGYGKSLHFCLHLVSEKIRKGMQLEQAVSKAVAEKFHLPFADYGRRKRLQEIAERKLLEFAKKNIDDLRNIEETESRLEFPVESAIISGRVDVIIKDKPNDKLEIRDYKTSDEVTTPEESSLQLRLYTLGLRSLGRPIDRATIAYLEDAKISPPINIDDKALEEAKTVAKGCIEGIQKSCFKSEKGNHCKDRCDQKQICKFYNH
jgi:DNA helicase-2/ATP-dependent DNA helicase PcrA